MSFFFYPMKIKYFGSVFMKLMAYTTTSSACVLHVLTTASMSHLSGPPFSMLIVTSLIKHVLATYYNACSNYSYHDAFYFFFVIAFSMHSFSSALIMHSLIIVFIKLVPISMAG